MPDYPGSEQKDGHRLIFRASITLRNGEVIYARDYGMRGFPIWIPA